MSSIRKQDAERLVNALDQEIRGRKRGTIGAINAALGHSHSWWQQRVISKDITVKQLLQVLDHLGLDPVKFVRQVIGAEDGLELDRPQGEIPDIVTKARAQESSKQVNERFSDALLKTLDEEKHQDPERVVEIASWVVDQVDLEMLPRLLGVVGSAFGLQFRLEEAEHCFYAGIEIAREHDFSSPLLGDLLTRLSYAVSNKGNHKEALRIAEKAALLSLRHKDLDGLGRALVAQGSWLYYLDRTRESIRTFEQALAYLHESSVRNRFAALQFLGLAHQRLGDLHSALRSAEKAKVNIPNDDNALAKLLWLQGRILAGLHRYEEAVLKLRKVVEIFQGLHLGEAALATCELVRIQLHQRQGKEAFETAISMQALLEPLQHNKFISAAIADLIRSGQEGLTVSLLERITARIEKERQNLEVWRSLQIG